MHNLQRQRLRLLREKRGLSQDALAAAMELPDRQALSDIENGAREVSPEELARAAKALGTTVFAIADPLQLVGEGVFSWRQKNVPRHELDAYEEQAGRWIAAFRYLSQKKGDPVNSGVRQIDLDHRSTFEDAQSQGESIAKLMNLGEIPAQTLSQALENLLDTVVLYVDAIPGVSGAACRVGALNTILVNRNEPPGRRAFDLAHEFFHLLTWHSMPPHHIDEAGRGDYKYKRIEQLADNFAAGLLMPAATIQQIVEHHPLPKEAELAAWIAAAARYMSVSPQAMLWRLVNLGHVSKAAGERVSLERERSGPGDSKPPLFGRRFLGVLSWAIDKGEISVRRAAALTGVSVDRLASIFKANEVACPYEL
ncbi:ImmA/IrrE family metallo-endopeptidase [Ramlibacter albus]|uniref:ImmA/IrrE family metallo-endopeptidase n=1 Tax=Ramlibacter albus TaxID=2079448 RepID=A0A923M907_9BURK|nr:XRE family transcriptional regulator [Ramlibacter albus]MBC5765118.1 ImmA/IrrE family metallo-endopeptidase [Ramlibacter albus]